MEPQGPKSNQMLDKPMNNQVKRDSIHVEALRFVQLLMVTIGLLYCRKEWVSMEQLSKAEPKYHINPYRK
jgi:hypothetical protein